MATTDRRASKKPLSDFERSRAGWELYHAPRRYPRANYPVTTKGETEMQGMNRLATLAGTIMQEIDAEAGAAADELLAAKQEARQTIGHFREHAGEIRKVAANVKAQLGQISNLPPPEGSGS